jgi:transcriptional regulator with XRE-family HTH domain
VRRYNRTMTLRQYRDSKGISQFTFAAGAGITPGTVANIERGNGCTARTAQLVIAATSGLVSLDDLVPVRVEGSEEQSSKGA